MNRFDWIDAQQRDGVRGHIVRARMALPAALLALSVLPWGSSPCRAQTTPPDPGTAHATILSCTLKTVQAGAFHDLAYQAEPTGESLDLTVVLSPDDRKAGRAVIIGPDRAAVVSLVVRPRQMLLIDTAPENGSSTLSLFPTDRPGTAMSAAYAQVAIDTGPVVSQSAGTCTPQ